MKTQTGHTPGPWNYENVTEDVLALLKTSGMEGSKTDLEIWSGNECIAVVRKKQDARLIAAAPDLLEALKDILNAGDKVSYLHAEMAAKQAITKATGGDL